MKLIEPKSALLKQNSKEEKEMLPFVSTQYQPLVSTVKEAYGKVDLKKNQPLLFANFLKNHPLFPTRKENHGKEHAC